MSNMVQKSKSQKKIKKNLIITKNKRNKKK